MFVNKKTVDFYAVFLFIIKLIVGFISRSQAMIADAFNSASDILSSIMTYIGNRVASKEADEDHNLGHGKAEYIYSMLISITMMVLGAVFMTFFFGFVRDVLIKKETIEEEIQQAM